MFRAICLILFTLPSLAQSPLQQQLRTIATDAHGTVSVACALPGSSLTCDLNPTARPPMQSVFKLPLALTILHQVEQGRLSLDQPIRFLPSDRIPPENWSPLQTQFPDANVDIPLRRLLELTVTVSDNTAADILLRTAGGAAVVNTFMASLGVGGFHLVDDEQALHRDQSLQYRDWFEPRSAVLLLRRLADHSPITPAHTALLRTWMAPTPRLQRIQANLPAGTVIAHRSGTSGMEHGRAAATNDIALITLPDHRELAIAIFITDATAPDTVRDQVIARIAQAAYRAALTSH